MKGHRKKIVYSILLLLAYSHTNILGMLKKQLKEQFEKQKRIDPKLVSIEPSTPPSPISPISPGSYPQRTTFLPKITNSTVSINNGLSKEEVLVTMLKNYNSILGNEKNISIEKELDVYYSCITLLNNIETLSYTKLLQYIKKENIALIEKNKSRIPRVIAWTVMSQLLKDIKNPLKQIINKKKLIEKIESSIGQYKFPARFLNACTNKVKSKKNLPLETIYLGPNKKIFAKIDDKIFFHTISLTEEKQNVEQPLRIKSIKNNSAKTGDYIVFEPNGDYAIIYSSKGPITLWNIAGEKSCIATLYNNPNGKNTVKNVLVSNGCKRVFTLFSDGSYFLQEIDTQAHSISKQKITSGMGAEKAILSPDGNLIAIDTKKHELWVNDVSKCRPFDNKKLFPSCTTENAIYSYLHPDKEIMFISFDPLSQYIAIITEGSKKKDAQMIRLTVCDLTKEKNNQPILDWELPESVTCMAFSPKGKYLALAYKNGCIHVFTMTKSNGPIYQFKLPTEKITDLVFDKDEMLLSANTKDGPVFVLDIYYGEITHILPQKNTLINNYFIDRWPLQRMLSAATNKTIYMWGSPICDLEPRAYLLLKYLLPYQIISDEKIDKNSWVRDSKIIKEINKQLNPLDCYIIQVNVTDGEIEKHQKIEIIDTKDLEKKEYISYKETDTSLELKPTKKKHLLMWLSNKKNAHFLQSINNVPLLNTFSGINIFNDWFGKECRYGLTNN